MELIGTDMWPFLFVTFSRHLGHCYVTHWAPDDFSLRGATMMFQLEGRASLRILHCENVVAARG